MSGVVTPGAALGVLGGGQLGRMFALAARRLGYRVHVYSPERDSPTGQVADRELSRPYEDLEAVAEFARGVSALSFEFENIPAATAETAARHTLVRPAGRVLHTTQNRLREKGFLRANGLPVTPFAPVRDAAGLETALGLIPLPAVLKTAAWGYDGKGQYRVDSAESARAAWAALEGREAVLEAFIDLACELSVVAARGADGSLALYPPIRNDHANHILDLSVLPAGLDPAVEREAAAIAREVMERLDVVGVLCVEFFLDRAGHLMVNEMAPRPHNSGHLTINACATCQFEQQVRALCGLPLGSTRMLQPAAMANLLGDLWNDGEPDWAAALAVPEVSLHLYGKAQPRPGRKMGHLTALAGDSGTALARARAARAALLGGEQAPRERERT